MPRHNGTVASPTLTLLDNQTEFSLSKSHMNIEADRTEKSNAITKARTHLPAVTVVVTTVAATHNVIMIATVILHSSTHSLHKII